jgi:hypothetical protein
MKASSCLSMMKFFFKVNYEKVIISVVFLFIQEVRSLAQTKVSGVIVDNKPTDSFC